MKKKHLVVVGVIILSAIVILGLYQTFALSSDITKDTSGYYNVTITDGTTITVPAGSTKTVYYKLTNTNKGIVKYGVGYSGTNITVKYYTDTIDPVTGTVDYGKSKYIKLSVENSGTVSSTAMKDSTEHHQIIIFILTVVIILINLVLRAKHGE